MRPCLLIAFGLLTTAAHADVLSLRSGAAPAVEATLALPERGLSMAQVEARHGRPQQRHAPVGGGAPQHPPITRWDYASFSVFFEHDRVIDTVVRDAPKPLHNVEQLRTATP